MLRGCSCMTCARNGFQDFSHEIFLSSQDAPHSATQLILTVTPSQQFMDYMENYSNFPFCFCNTYSTDISLYIQLYILTVHSFFSFLLLSQYFKALILLSFSSAFRTIQMKLEICYYKIHS